jgi:glutamate/tyrosine decarboxylase-like PLP-dependent enzyme
MAPDSAAYLPGEGEKRDPSEWVPESSRRARGFTLYAAIRSLGRNGLCEMVERHCRQARLMASLLKEDPGIRILNDVVLNQVLVRFIDPEGKDDGVFTKRVMSHVQEEGTCWAGGSRWEGADAMRISVSNWATTDEDIKISAQAIRRVLARLVE